jgi:hypothetical protein
MSRTYRKKHHHWCLEDHYLIKRLVKRKYCCREHKPWHKPPKWFKQMKRRQFRAKCKDSMVKGREYPRERRNYIWEWI